MLKKYNNVVRSNLSELLAGGGDFRHPGHSAVGCGVLYLGGFCLLVVVVWFVDANSRGMSAAVLYILLFIRGCMVFYSEAVDLPVERYCKVRV
jgi:hypothetical protein